MLKSLAQKCDFKAGTLHEMLRDRLVCVINEASIQKGLLSETKLMYESAVKKAQAMEAARDHAKEMQAVKKQEDEETVVHNEPVHVLQRQQRGIPVQCYRCGNTNHAGDRCRFKDARCFGCGKVGHINRVCQSKQRQPAPAVNEQVVQEEFVEPPTTPEHPFMR